MLVYEIAYETGMSESAVIEDCLYRYYLGMSREEVSVKGYTYDEALRLVWNKRQETYSKKKKSDLSAKIIKN